MQKIHCGRNEVKRDNQYLLINKKDPRKKIFFDYRAEKNYDSDHAVPAPSVVTLTNQKIILMINHATQIRINPVAQCFKIVNHAPYLSSSPPEVTI
jgi:hypothetical protein